MRVALGYKRQEDLAKVLGFGQQQMSNWKTGKPIKDYAAVAHRLSILTRYLADPVKYQGELHQATEPMSPILWNPDLNQQVVEATYDFSLTPEEWDKLLGQCTWAHSLAPFRSSAILRFDQESRGIFFGVKGFPGTQALAADLTVHGEAYLRFFQDQWTTSGELGEFEEVHRQGDAMVAGSFLLLRLAGLPVDDWLPLQESVPRVLVDWEPSDKKMPRGPWLLSMDFLSKVLALCEGSDGALDAERLQMVRSVAQKWSLKQRDRLTLKGKAEIFDVQAKYKEFLEAQSDAPQA